MRIGDQVHLSSAKRITPNSKGGNSIKNPSRRNNETTSSNKITIIAQKTTPENETYYLLKTDNGSVPRWEERSRLLNTHKQIVDKYEKSQLSFLTKNRNNQANQPFASDESENDQNRDKTIHKHTSLFIGAKAPPIPGGSKKFCHDYNRYQPQNINSSGKEQFNTILNQLCQESLITPDNQQFNTTSMDQRDSLPPSLTKSSAKLIDKQEQQTQQTWQKLLNTFNITPKCPPQNELITPKVDLITNNQDLTNDVDEDDDEEELAKISLLAKSIPTNNDKTDLSTPKKTQTMKNMYSPSETPMIDRKQLQSQENSQTHTSSPLIELLQKNFERMNEIIKKRPTILIPDHIEIHQIPIQGKEDEEEEHKEDFKFIDSPDNEEIMLEVHEQDQCEQIQFRKDASHSENQQNSSNLEFNNHIDADEVQGFKSRKLNEYSELLNRIDQEQISAEQSSPISQIEEFKNTNDHRIAQQDINAAIMNYGDFEKGDHAQKIITCRPKQNGIFMEIQWYPRQDGTIPLRSTINSKIVRMYDRNLLIDFYESKIKFTYKSNEKKKADLSTSSNSSFIKKEYQSPPPKD